MASLKKIAGGLLYHDDFQEQSLLWNLSPSVPNNLRFTEDGLFMQHGKGYSMYTILEPEDQEYSCIVELNHEYSSVDDIGGIIVFGNNQQFAECQTGLFLKEPETKPPITTDPGEDSDDENIYTKYCYNSGIEDFAIFEINGVLQNLPNNPNNYVPFRIITHQSTEIDPYVLFSIDDEENLTHATFEIDGVLQDIEDNPNHYVPWMLNNKLQTGEVTEPTNPGGSTTDPDTTITGPEIDGPDIVYHFIKFFKKGRRYVFFASPDGYEWIEVGNVWLKDTNRIGFFLYGTENQNTIDNSLFNIKSFDVYKNNYLTFTNIRQGYDIEITDKNGKILVRSDHPNSDHICKHTNNRFTINTTTLPIPIEELNLSVYESGHYPNVIARYILEENVFGGDKYRVEEDLKLIINNQEMSQENIFDLGIFLENNYFVKAALVNNEDYSIKNLKLKLIRYSEYYSGEEEVKIALADNTEKYHYKKQLTIQEIKPHESCNLIFKLTRNPYLYAYTAADKYRFKLVVE